MHLKALYQINARNTHVADDLQFIMQSTFLGVLTGQQEKIVLVLEQDLNPRLYQPLFWPSFLLLIISGDKSVEIYFI